MNIEERFERIVGLIDESAQDVNCAGPSDGPDAVMDAVLTELRAMGGSLQDADGLIRRLSRHLVHSDRLQRRIRQLEVQQSIQQIEMDQLSFGLVWVAEDLKVVLQNVRATLLLQSGGGICIRDGRLTAWIATDTGRLELALRNALHAGERQGILLALHQRDQPVPLLASVIPVTCAPAGVARSAGSARASGRFALVVLQNPDEAAIGLKHLQIVYGFTAAQCKLAEALLRNDTLESFSQRSGVARSTLRSHLALLFKKTGTKRQSELVRLLMLAQPRM